MQATHCSLQAVQETYPKQTGKESKSFQKDYKKASKN